jgi:hypothetical protein
VHENFEEKKGTNTIRMFVTSKINKKSYGST